MIWLSIILGIHLLFWMIMFLALSNHKDDVTHSSSTVSSITAVKNGKDNLDSFSNNLIHQELDEIILVDDFSTDDGFLSISNPKIIVTNPDRDITGKKEAVIQGITTATSELLLFTDVDCNPPKHWAKAMKNRIGKSDILLGYGPMNRLKGWVPLFSRYETYHTAIQYLSMVKLNQAYMGVGRNMMVNRLKAMATIPILKSSKMASGDDDLMINYLAEKNNVAICLDPETHVFSDPKENLIDFIKQKARHISSSVEYRFSHQVILFLYSFSFLAFYIGLIIGFAFSMITYQEILFLLVVKWIIQMFFNYFLMKKLNEMDLLKYFPLLDILMFLYLIILTPYFMIQNKNEWN